LSWGGNFTTGFVLYNPSMARTLSLKKILEILRQQIPMLTERYSVEKLGVFRSYVRPKQKINSDLDVPGPLKDTRSLLRFIAIEVICLIFSALRWIW
jgi:predicted nucleotidyltransferase